MRGTLVVLFAIALGTTLVVVSPRWFEPDAGAGGGGRGEGGAGRRGVITYTVWGMPFEDRLFEDLWARGFERESPGTRVEYQRYPDAVVKYNAWHARGFGPEVMRLPITEYHTFVRRGMLERLDPYIDDPGEGLSPEDLADIPPMLLDALRVDGSIYALPEDSAQFGLFYNRRIFDEHNAAHPDRRVPYPDATWTWSDLRAAARALTVRAEPDALPTTLGFDATIWAWPFINFFAQAGGELWTEDGLTTRVNSPAGVEALAFMRALVVEDASWVPSFGKEQGTGPEARFADGKTAMLLGGSWLVPSFELQNPGLDFAVAPAPRGRVRAIVCGCVTRAMSASARDKPNAWRMHRFLARPEQAAAYWDVLRVAPPASISVLRSPGFRATSGVPDPEHPGEYLVPPMTEARFDARAAWLLDAITPDAETGRAPGFVPTGPYQARLEKEIEAMLQQYLQACARARRAYVSADEDARRSILAGLDPVPSLARVADAVHADIDRDRAGERLGPVERP